MERQTKHRILGILVIIGLVIILLPLFQGGGDLSTNTALVQAPPFPDQPIQVNAETTQAIPVASQTALNEDNNAPNPDDDIISATHPSVISDQQLSVVSEPAAVEAENTTKKSESVSSTSTTTIGINSDDTIQFPLTHAEDVKSEMAVNKQKQTEELASNNVEVEKTSRYRIIEGEKAASILQKSHAKRSRQVKTISMRTANTVRPIEEAAKTAEIDRLSKLKSAAWVIQVGSYKNKANALRIVNQLRANGYRAFIQEISTDSGDDHTRVYVGPENKRTAARALADRLQNEMHVDGIVISYQPLTL